MGINEEKKALRKRVRHLKSEISKEEKKAVSDILLKNLEGQKIFRESGIIMAYWSMDDEVNTHSFIRKWAKEKRIILPSVDGDQLLLKEFSLSSGLVAGERYGIPEPEGGIFKESNAIELILVPGMAFDIKKNRMGRGKAYYDKLLNSLKAVKIGICFDFQVFESVPVDNYDISMDMLITEKRIIGPV